MGLEEAVASVVTESRKLVRACRASGLPAPIESLEASLRILDAERGDPGRSTECACVRKDNQALLVGQLELGREYLLIRDGKEPFRFMFLRPAARKPSGGFDGMMVRDIETGDERVMYYSDVGMKPYALGKWSESCIVIKAEMDSQDARRLLKLLVDDEDFPTGPVA